MQKILLTVFAAIIACCFTGCGGAASNSTASAAKPAFTGKLTSNLKLPNSPEFINEFDVKQGMLMAWKADTFMKDAKVNGTTHEFYITNYEFKHGGMEGERLPKSDKDAALKFEVITEKGQPLKVGTYPAANPSDGANIIGKTRSVYVRYMLDGKPKSGSSTADYPHGTRKGMVKIDSINGDMVTGEIDISDDANSFKGTFSAQIAQ